MANDIVQVVYTNSNCNDVFPVFYGQNKKHTKLPLCSISDYAISEAVVMTVYKYNNKQAYYSVWIDALKQLGYDYFIYLQEDFFLYSDVNEDVLKEYLDILENSDYSFVRLLKSGKLNDKEISKNLYEIESTNVNIFAMQATLWKTEDYIKLMDSVKSTKWLETETYREQMIKLGLKGLYHYSGEDKVGRNHWASDIYPYIATAVVKGKWNFKEYKTYLEPMLAEYGLNFNIRGTL